MWRRFQWLGRLGTTLQFPEPRPARYSLSIYLRSFHSPDSPVRPNPGENMLSCCRLSKERSRDTRTRLLTDRHLLPLLLLLLFCFLSAVSGRGQEMPPPMVLHGLGRATIA